MVIIFLTVEMTGESQNLSGNNVVRNIRLCCDRTSSQKYEPEAHNEKLKVLRFFFF